ncbi:hypothetical protein L3X38_003750 [Prunus dulcis]|uniref:Uncharacterized protein n=1 Tax=Prunus dulcis TaxID=3755 RepID=A0AAD4ZMN6_PRUDU|nr:hypothetical protein L3X38_003750 [Prunus dulcis]
MDKTFVFDEEDEVMIEQDDEERVCLDDTGLETPTKCSIKSYKELRKVLFIYFKLLAKMTLNSNGRRGDANNCETTVMEVEEEPTEAEADGEVGEEDAMEDFIVNEEFDATGVPVRQTLGVSSSSLHEVDEIFGDVDELLLLRKQGSDSNERRARKLEDEFEPSVLSKKYMTEKDDRFRSLIFRKEFR